MQENRENDRNAGTGDIRLEAIASELKDVDEAEKERLYQQAYQAEIDSISLDADTFTHPISAYQLLAVQGNEGPERMLNLVHTSESMLKAKDAINKLPYIADDVSEEFGDDSEDGEDILGDEEDMNLGGDAGPSSSTALPNWVLDKECTLQKFTTSLLTQVRQIQQAIQQTTDAGTKALFKPT